MVLPGNVGPSDTRLMSLKGGWEEAEKEVAARGKTASVKIQAVLDLRPQWGREFASLTTAKAVVQSTANLLQFK